MNTNNETVTKKGGLPKGIIAMIIVIALLLVGGTVAYMMANKSVKQKYFSAELATIEFAENIVKKRFESELKWAKFTNENPTEANMEVSAEYNNPYDDGYDMYGISEIINNSKITVSAQSDMKNKQVATEIGADIAGVSFDGLQVYLTDKNLLLGLPFLTDILQVKGTDISRLLHDADPYTFPEDLEIDFSQLFDQQTLVSEEDKEHFKKEYGKMLYDELSDSSFQAEKETIKVNGEDVKAEKLTFHLEEKELKELLKLLVTKLEKDEKIKKMLEKQLETTLAFDDVPFDDFMADFDDALVEIKDSIDDLVAPDGMTSTIWVNDSLIVKRDFTLSLGVDKDDLATVAVSGTQSLSSDHQMFDYEFKAKDSYDEGSLRIEGDLSWKDDKIKDSISLTVEDVVLGYEANETLTKNNREFERVFTFEDGYEVGSLFWSGQSTYEEDNMNSEHHFSVVLDDIERDFFTLTLVLDGKKIKNVDFPDSSAVVDLGEMSTEEFYDYIMHDVAVQFEEWYENLIGDFTGFSY